MKACMRASRVAVLTAVVLLSGGRPGIAQFGASPDEWFSGEIPEAGTVTERQFVNQDARYLELLRTLSGAVVKLAESSATVESGESSRMEIDAEQYESLREAMRAYTEAHPDAAEEFSGSEMPDLDSAEFRELYEQMGYSSTQTTTRLMASPTQLRIESTNSHSFSEDVTSYTSTVQRAWRGGQSWSVWSKSENSGSAQLVSAGSSEVDEGWPGAMPSPPW